MKIVSDKVKQYWKYAKDFCVYRVLHADDPPHRLALGIAVGMFVTLLPLIGIQMMLSVFLAWLVRANKLVGIPLVWISNPVTFGPIYYPCYRLGCAILGEPVVNETWVQLKTEWQELLADPATTWGRTISFWWQGLMDIVQPLFLGCFVVATTMGVLSYYVSLLAIRSYRLRRWGQLMPPKLTPVDEVGGPAELSAQANTAQANTAQANSGQPNTAQAKPPGEGEENAA